MKKKKEKINKKFQGRKSKISPASLVFSKQAQMKIQQMSFLLLAVFIFFALVGMFILSIRMSGMKESATKLQEENAMLLVSKVANSPEFSCGLAYGRSEKTDCIDADKVMMLKQNINKYSDFWGVESIEIMKIYPSARNIECTPVNYPNCNVIRLGSSSGYGVSNFVALCRKEVYRNKIQDRCELAKIIVRYKEAST